MQDGGLGQGGASGGDIGASRTKLRWHAPVLKRLDVDLTAGTPRTSNEMPPGRNQFAGSTS